MLRVIKDKTTTKDVARNISKYISSPPENSRVVTYTPEIAAWVMDTYNEGNRPKKPMNIKRYAEDMKNDKWGLTGDTIKFSDEGKLRDGQNRMMACVRSGSSFTSHTVFGINDELFHVMDTGKTRGASDVLSIAGYTNTNNLASALRWAYILKNDPNSRLGVSNELILELVRGDYAEVCDSMPAGTRLYNQYNHPIGQMAALHWFLSGVNKELADSFFDDWSSGKSNGRARVVGRLQSALARVKDSNHGRIHDTIRAAMIIKGWNLYYNKRKGSDKSCLMSLGEDFPEVEGM
jgi:hypothetical protein